MRLLSKLPGLKSGKDLINDRRASKRYELLLKLNYRDSAGKIHGEILTKNVCKNGLRFPVKILLSPGTILEINIEDPFFGSVKYAKALVIWSGKLARGDETENITYEVGVRLLNTHLY